MSIKITDKDKEISAVNILKSANKLLDLSTAVVMGIINSTPDSFYSGSRHQDKDSILRKADEHLKGGAQILDIGAVSTRPGAEEVSIEEEGDRLAYTYDIIRQEFPEVWISIDTWRAEIAETMILSGADMINDISGGTMDQQMPEIIGKYNIPYVLMHIKGTPQNMQNDPTYEDVTSEVLSFINDQIKVFNQYGAHQLVIDPGFGFGKTLEHNYTLMKDLRNFTELNYPVLAGISRKSMINKLLNILPEEALNGTSVLNTLALINGAKILRVHDSKEAFEAVKIVQALDA
ncbi:MAG: dihydropteroate synthase [Bacteroidetes bacterium]|nr:dihydropteroate synthase [Bacteroidota bacterium]|tara:strand:- start:164 stop:1033 length:870 start_codon:yes stop_codon:yes gene_type:complete